MQSMRYRSLGDAQVGAIGLGDISQARSAARGVVGTERIAHEAIERGIDIVDATEDAERVAGDAVRELHARDRVVLVTRIPLLADREYADGRRNLVSDRLPPLYVQSRVEASLRATRIEPLSLAMLPISPAWLESSAWPELVGTCERLRREGLVRRWGAIIAGDTAITEPWLSAIAVRFNACTRGAMPAITAALAAKLAVLAYEPLAGGALGGRLGPGALLKPSDDRHGVDLDAIAVGVAKLAALVKVTPPAAESTDAAREALATAKRPAELDCETVAELALRYVIDRGVIAMPRMHYTEQLIDAVRYASAPPLPADLVERIESTI